MFTVSRERRWCSVFISLTRTRSYVTHMLPRISFWKPGSVCGFSSRIFVILSRRYLKKKKKTVTVQVRTVKNPRKRTYSRRPGTAHKSLLKITPSFFFCTYPFYPTHSRHEIHGPTCNGSFAHPYLSVIICRYLPYILPSSPTSYAYLERRRSHTFARILYRY